MKKNFLSITLCILCLLFFNTLYAASQVKVGFIVQDYSGKMEPTDYKEWKQVTRWAYRIPYYKVLDDSTIETAKRILNAKKVDKTKLLEAAKQSDLNVIVFVRLYDFSELIEQSHYCNESGPLVRINVNADIIVYRKDSDKILIDNVYENELKEMGNYTSPWEIVKWKLCDLVNTMEGRELIR